MLVNSIFANTTAPFKNMSEICSNCAGFFNYATNLHKEHVDAIKMAEVWATYIYLCVYSHSPVTNLLQS